MSRLSSTPVKVALSAAIMAAAVAFLIGPKPDSATTSTHVVAASGAMTVEVLDPVHGRPFEVSTWTPGQNDTSTLVVLSHGFSGDRTSHTDLAKALAATGHTVAAPTHPDLAGLESNDTRLDPLVLRPRHLSLTIDHMSNASAEPFHRVVIVGHSLGGYSALRLAGAAPAGANIDQHCASQPADQILCAATARDRFADLVANPADAADPRVDAIVLLAPGYGPLFSSDDLDAIDANVLVIAADSDDELPGEQVSNLVRTLPNDARSTTVAGGHYVFLRPCTDAERETLPELCVDDPSVDRAAVHNEIAQEIQAFLR